MVFQHTTTGQTYRHTLAVGADGLANQFDGIFSLELAGSYNFSTIVTVGADIYTVPALSADGVVRTVAVVAATVDHHITVPSTSQISSQVCLQRAQAGVRCTFTLAMFDDFGNAQPNGVMYSTMTGISGAALGREIAVATSKTGNVVTFGYIIYKPTGRYNLELFLEGDTDTHEGHDHGIGIVVVTGEAVLAAGVIVGDATIQAGSFSSLRLQFPDAYNNMVRTDTYYKLLSECELGVNSAKLFIPG